MRIKIQIFHEMARYYKTKTHPLKKLFLKVPAAIAIEC